MSPFYAYHGSHCSLGIHKSSKSSNGSYFQIQGECIIRLNNGSFFGLISLKSSTEAFQLHVKGHRLSLHIPHARVPSHKKSWMWVSSEGLSEIWGFRDKLLRNRLSPGPSLYHLLNLFHVFEARSSEKQEQTGSTGWQSPINLFPSMLPEAEGRGASSAGVCVAHHRLFSSLCSREKWGDGQHWQVVPWGSYWYSL